MAGGFDQAGTPEDAAETPEAATAVAVSNIAFWNGTAWSALGGTTDRIVLDVAVDSEDNVYAGGNFSQIGGVNANQVAQWDGENWSALGTGVSGIVNSNPISISTLAVDSEDNVYAGGTFSTAGAISANSIARWDGSSWNALGNGVTNNGGLVLESLAVDSADNVYAGGDFSTAGIITTSVNNIARWDGSSWSTLDNGVVSNNANAVLSVITDSGDNVYVGGQFDTANGTAIESPRFAHYLTQSATCVGGTLSNNRWEEISLSCDPGPNNTVADILGDDLGADGYATTWIVFGRTPSGSNAPLSLSSTLEQGRAYWTIHIIGEEGNEIAWDIDAGTETPVVMPDVNPNCPSSAGCFAIDLASPASAAQVRTNLRGYPFSEPLSFADVLVEIDGTDVCRPGDAIAAGLIGNELFNYDGTSYASFNDLIPFPGGGVLQPSQGFWVRTGEAAVGRSLRLLVSRGSIDGDIQALAPCNTLEPVPQVALSAAFTGASGGVIEESEGGSVEVTFTLSAPLPTPLAVRLVLSPDSTAEPIDIISVDELIFTIPAGETSLSGSVFPNGNDNTLEGAEDAIFNIDVANLIPSVTVADPLVGTIRILDEDIITATVFFSGPANVVVTPGLSQAINIQLSTPALENPLPVVLAISSDDLVENVDFSIVGNNYNPATQTVTFPPGSSGLVQTLQFISAGGDGASTGAVEIAIDSVPLGCYR